MSAKTKAFPNVLIRASAGSGKTFQLTNRFLALAFSGTPVDEILAATFTRKAAGEILDRLLTRLAEAAANSKKAAELAGYLDDRSIDSARCLALLRQMVDGLHRLRAGTLDSFFMQIAGSFSLELGLPLGWKIIDETVDARLRTSAVRQVLTEGSDGEVVKLVRLLTKGETIRSVAEQIHQLINGLYSIYGDSPAEAWTQLPKPVPLSADALASARESLSALTAPNNNKSFQKARDGDLAALDARDWETLFSKGVAGKVFADEDTYSRVQIPPDWKDAYRPILKHARAVVLCQIANQTEATRQLLERFDKFYRKAKSENRALRFDDVTRCLAETNAAGPNPADRLERVQYRLDANVKNLLLDEFQDTSPAQWRVLRPFAESAAAAGSFFCVGDVKQAIYGWRGGVAEIFDTLRGELPGLQAESLNQSFRSSPIVIDAVNRVFENLRSNPALDRYRTGVEQWSGRFDRHSTAKTALGGYCRLTTAPRSQNGPQAVATLRFAAEEIARMAAESPQATIGVLVRRNAAVARLIFELRRLGVEASEEGGNPLTDSPAVQLALSLLTLADHPGHTIARFHVATSPLGARLEYTDHADNDVAWRLARRIRRQLFDQGYGPTLLGWAELLAPDCDRRDMSRLSQLVDLGYEYEPDANSRPSDFAALVESRRVESPSAAPVRVMTIHQAKGLQFDVVVLPELDAKIVGQPSEVVVGRSSPTGPVESVCRYVAKATRPALPAKFQALFEDAERQIVEESLCVFYVAMTRAVHSLHMIVDPSRENERTIPSTYAGVLRAALTDGKPAGPATTLFEHGDPNWWRGFPAVAPVEAPAEITAVRLAPPVDRRVRGLERRSPSGLEGGERIRIAGLFDRKPAALERGSLVHERLEAIEWLDESTPLDEPLRRLFEKPAIRALFTRPTGDRARCRVYRERPFALRDGNTILSGAIDRLVVFEGGAEIIDFKTDTVAADDPAALAAKVEFYRPQLDAYRRAVAAMYRLPTDRVAARLAFLSPGVVVDI